MILNHIIVLLLFHLTRKRVFETWTGTSPKIIFFHRNGGCYGCCATMWSLSTGILFQSSRNCQSCQIWPAKFGQILIRTDTRLVFCNTKLMRTDIFFSRTTKPISNFVNSESCKCFPHENKMLTLAYKLGKQRCCKVIIGSRVLIHDDDDNK